MNTSFPYNRLQEVRYRRLKLWCAFIFTIALCLAAEMAFAQDLTLVNVGSPVGVTGADGVTNGATEYNNNSDQYVTDNLSITQDYTVEFWTKDPGSGGNAGYIFSQNSNTLALTNNGVQLLPIQSVGAICYTATPTGWTAEIGVWHHFAWTYDGSTGRNNYYKDGVLVYTDAPGGCRGSTTTGRLYLGGFNATPLFPYTGSLDDVKISNGVLSQSDIQNDYNTRHASNGPNVVGIWRMGGLAGESATNNIASLTLTSAPPIVAGAQIQFNLASSGATDIFYEEFYYGADPTKHFNIGKGFNIGGNFNFNFAATYPDPGTFLPRVLLGNSSCTGTSATGSLTGAGCSYQTVYGSAVVGSDNSDLNYNFFFHPANGSHLVNQNDPWSYKIDPSLCPLPGGFSGAVMYHGYVGSLGAADSGVILSGLSGSGFMVFGQTSRELGYDPHPYIKVSCGNNLTLPIYYQDTLYGSRSTGYAVIPDPVTSSIGVMQSYYLGTNFTNGGYSTDYNATTGSGASFFTDKTDYKLNEAVKSQFYYQTSFVPASIAFFPDYNGQDSRIFSTGSLLTNGIVHNFSFFYNITGTHYPVIQVRSSGFTDDHKCPYASFTCPGGTTNSISTYRNIALGGNIVRDPNKYITVSYNSISTGIQTGILNTLFGLPTSSGRVIIENTGVFGTGANTLSYLATNDGIFGLDPATFQINFGAPDNQALTWAGDLATILIKGMLYMASYGWHVIKLSPVYSFIDQSFHPVAGSIEHLPTKIFNQPLPFAPADATFTITYANEKDSKAIIWFVNLFILGSIMLLSLKSIFH